VVQLEEQPSFLGYGQSDVDDALHLLVVPAHDAERADGVLSVDAPEDAVAEVDDRILEGVRVEVRGDLLGVRRPELALGERVDLDVCDGRPAQMRGPFDSAMVRGQRLSSFLKRVSLRSGCSMASDQSSRFSASNDE